MVRRHVSLTARALSAALVLLLSSGCAHTLQGVEPASSPARSHVRKAVNDARTAFRNGDEPRVSARLAEARTLAGSDPDLLDAVAAADAGLHVERKDLAGAARLLLERLAAAERAHRRNEGNLHDYLIFVEEAQGDYLAAYFEAVEMRSAVEREPPPWSARVRQGNYWQRAHTLRRLAEALTGDERAAALLYAREARDEFAALAHESGHALQSIVLLDEEIAALDGRCDEALKLARSLKVEELDPQDLYTTSFVFQKCGDDASARSLRQKIEANSDLDLFDAVYRYLARRADDAPVVPGRERP